MNTPQLFRKTEERTFFAHHMLLHAGEQAIADAASSEVGRFNKCFVRNGDDLARESLIYPGPAL